MTLNPADPRGWRLRTRYALDRLLAILAVLALSPLLVGLALAVRFKMGAPILFRQARMGRDGQVFDMLKFRTMWGAPRQNGEHDARWAAGAMSSGASPIGGPSPNGAIVNGKANGHDLDGNGYHANGNSASIAGPGAQEDRRTGLGRFLRRWSLDELPQLLNVVRGEMALVGPRPERVRYANEFEKAVYRYRDRARIRPGITGWAQINGLRGQTSLADRVEWDNLYIENWSVWLDAKILALTVVKALRSETE